MTKLEEQLDEIVVSQERIAKALEHTHKCEEEISKTLKELLKIHKKWSIAGVKYLKP